MEEIQFYPCYNGNSCSATWTHDDIHCSYCKQQKTFQEELANLNKKQDAIKCVAE